MGDPNETLRKGTKSGLEEQWDRMLAQCHVIFNPSTEVHAIPNSFRGNEWVGFYTLAQQIEDFEQTVKDKSPGLAVSQFYVLINSLATSLHDRSISIDKGIVVFDKLRNIGNAHNLM
jgi:hypothetical protein